MAMKLQFRCLSIVAGIGLVGFIAGCPVIPVDLCAGVDCEVGFTCDADTGTCVSSGPQAFLDADATRGGSMYDKWWAVAGLDAPIDDHPFWSTQATNTRSGADTWRCKECHGWDYKGVDGAYGSGSHMTGFAGLFDTTISAQEAFDAIKTDHGYDGSGLSDDDIWDLAKFVLEGQIDTDDILDANNAFIGDVGNGQTLYDDGVGANVACAVCHGADGLTINFKTPPDEEFIGGLADGNPWEFQHKVRFGHPGTGMPASFAVGTNQDVADVGTYSQTLP